PTQTPPAPASPASAPPLLPPLELLPLLLAPLLLLPPKPLAPPLLPLPLLLPDSGPLSLGPLLVDSEQDAAAHATVLAERIDNATETGLLDMCLSLLRVANDRA